MSATRGVAFAAICERWALPTANVAYIGDDSFDLLALVQAGLATTVPNAAAAVRQRRAHWLATLNGGDGAVREMIEAVLRVQGRLDELVQRYLTGGGS